MNGAGKQSQSASECSPPRSPETAEATALMEAGLLAGGGEAGYGAVTSPSQSADAKEKKEKKVRKAVVDLMKM